MYITEDHILKGIEEPQEGKLVVSVDVAKEVESRISAYLTGKPELSEKINSVIFPSIKNKLSLDGTFPISQPKINGLYVHDNEIYKLVGSRNIEKIVCNSYDMFILMKNHDIYSCGYNDYGDVGNDKTGAVVVPTKIEFSADLVPEGFYIKDIATRAKGTHFLRNDGRIIVCGYNGYGQLGIGNTTNKTVKELSTFDAGGKHNVKKIVCTGSETYQSTYYLTEEDKIYVCGHNAYGCLGTGNTTNLQQPIEITDKFANEGGVVQVDGGLSHVDGKSTIFLTKTGKVFTVGYNGYGQLGIGNTTNSTALNNIAIPTPGTVTHVACGGGVSSIVVDKKKLYSCGYNGNGAVGTGNTSVNPNTFTFIKEFDYPIKKISHRTENNYEAFSVVLLENGDVYTCGYNSQGQLGQGHQTNEGYYLKIDTDGKFIVDVDQSYRGLHLLTEDGFILVYGSNSNSQLGIGVAGSFFSMPTYSSFNILNSIKASYTTPDEDFVQIL